MSLDKYCRDLTALARQQKIDPVIGRDEEIRRASGEALFDWAPAGSAFQED